MGYLKLFRSFSHKILRKKTSNTSFTFITLVISMQVSVKNVEDRVFREFKAESVRERLSMGKALTLAMKLWLDYKPRKPRLYFLNLQPKKWKNGTEHVSEEIDKIIY